MSKILLGVSQKHTEQARERVQSTHYELKQEHYVNSPPSQARQVLLPLASPGLFLFMPAIKCLDTGLRRYDEKKDLLEGVGADLCVGPLINFDSVPT